MKLQHGKGKHSVTTFLKNVLITALMKWLTDPLRKGFPFEFFFGLEKLQIINLSCSAIVQVMSEISKVTSFHSCNTLIIL